MCVLARVVGLRRAMGGMRRARCPRVSGRMQLAVALQARLVDPSRGSRVVSVVQLPR